ncbi:hypothetical protein HDU96_006628 [Phlyctochytrium bullatum]|nr:hypothetical protein HDU96_006628 [Phlyctochytrium bullatum]
MSITVPLYRTALHRTRHSIRRTRSLLHLLPNPTPENTRIDPVAIQRRSTLLLEGMHPDQATGLIPGEWVYHHNPKPSASTAPRDAAEPDRVVLFLHGGGYLMGSASSHRFLTSKFAELAHARVLAIDYRLAPEHTFPLPLHDAISAYLSLVDPPAPAPGCPQPKRYDPSQVFLAGDSAGGGLCLALALWLRDHPRFAPPPAGIVALAPWLDLTHSQPSFRLNADLDYLPEAVTDPAHIVPGVRSHAYTPSDALNAHPYVSPVFGSDAPGALPPTLVQLGERERLRDEGIVFAAERFRRSPVRLEVYEDQVHVFQVFGDAVGQAALRRAGEFIRSVATGGNASVDDPVTHPSAPGFLAISTEGHVAPLPREAALAMVAEGRHELERRARDEVASASTAVRNRVAVAPGETWWTGLLAPEGVQGIGTPPAPTGPVVASAGLWAAMAWVAGRKAREGGEDLLKGEMRLRLPLFVV